MGCDVYRIEQPQSGDAHTLLRDGFTKPVSFMFPDNQDDCGCLCTFPHNYRESVPFPVYELALLGAFVVMAHHRNISPDDPDSWGVRGIPDHIPDWIKVAIKRQIKGA